MRLLDPRCLQIIENSLDKITIIAVLRIAESVNQFVVLVHAEHAMRRDAFHSKWPSHADFLFVGVGLVVKVFKLGFGGYGGINLFLPSDALPPPFSMQLLGWLRPRIGGSLRQRFETVVSV